MRVGSLFSGIGGMDLGLERAGFEIRWQVENNPYCQEVLAKHWPHVTRYGDIKAIDWGAVEPVDLICGGFPCQPFSLAGKRRGSDDDRYLWPEVVRCLTEQKPTWFLGENVPGLINLGLDQVLSDLESLGYETGTLCVPACAVDAPHIRQRIWILAYHAERVRSGGGVTVERDEAQQPARGLRGDVADAERTERGPLDQARDDHRTNGHAQRAEGADRARGGRKDVADSDAQRELQPKGMQQDERGWAGNGSRWCAEPERGRVAHGVPHRVDRLRGLGNAIVPQIAEAIGRMILAAN